MEGAPIRCDFGFGGLAPRDVREDARGMLRRLMATKRFRKSRDERNGVETRFC